VIVPLRPGRIPARSCRFAAGRWAPETGGSALFVRLSAQLLNKLLGFKSATSIIAETVYVGTPETSARLLGLWELAIGLCLFIYPLARMGLGLLAIRLPGTLLALIVKADVCWDEPFVPTVQGQYLIKDVVLITAAMVIGGTLRTEHRSADVRH